jgi:glycosyltransferase involved in cell wall biosynthesis
LVKTCSVKAQSSPLARFLRTLPWPENRRGNLRVLLVHVHAYLPQLLGGVEQTSFELVKRLARSGHEAAVMCGLNKHDAVWMRNRVIAKICGHEFPPQRYGGSLVYRGYDPMSGLSQVLADFAPDALVIAGNTAVSFELAAHAARSGLPCAYYFHDIKTLRNLQAPQLLDGIRLLASSRFTAGVALECLGRDATVLTPLIDADSYRTATSGQHVTMVNPRRIKGGQTALELAQACPDIPFTFVEAWAEEDEFLTQLRKAVRRLPNVKWLRPTLKMRKVYNTTRILLAPSECEEAWGRVVSEAQVSGIPVLASARGGLPEAVGPGGILLEPGASLGDWVKALRSLWDDAELYTHLSGRALAHAQRPEADPQHQVEVLLAALRSPGARHEPRPAGKVRSSVRARR